MNYKTQIQTYLKHNKGFLFFVAGAGFMLFITVLTLGNLWYQSLQAEQYRITYADVLPEQLVKNQNIRATVAEVTPSKETKLLVRLSTTGKYVPVKTTQDTDIQKRVSKDTQTYQKEVEEFQEKIQSGDLEGLKKPKTYTIQDIELAGMSKGQNVIIKPEGNVIGSFRIPAQSVSVVANSSS